MFKVKSTLTALALTITALGASSQAEAQNRTVYQRGEIFQNVAAEHVMPLLANTAWVTHWWDGKGRTGGKPVRIVWYGANGQEHICLTGSDGKTAGWNAGSFAGYSKDLKFYKVQYPLKQSTFRGKTGYQLLRYDGETGELTTYLAQNRRWWESDVGHLQAKIPAVTWEICPNFPSAESLGAEVNHKQTARNYLELIAQDPGQRILRPQYQNDHAHEWYGRNAGKNKK